MNKTKNAILNLAMWVGLSFIISLIISFLIPFPYSLVIIIAVFIFMGYYLRNIKIVGRKMVD